MQLPLDVRELHATDELTVGRRALVRVDDAERVWPAVPASERGRRLTRAEEDEILGYGSGV